MHHTEVAKHKRHCGTCNADIPKGEAHIVYGSEEQRVGGRNLCAHCAVGLIGEIAEFRLAKTKEVK